MAKGNFSQEVRFKEMPFYCRGTGESCYLGPGSYNDNENYKKLKSRPCTAVWKKGTHLDNEESKKSCYILVGHQIKYEPAFVNNNHKKVIESLQVQNGSKSITQALENPRNRVKSAI